MINTLYELVISIFYLSFFLIIFFLTDAPAEYLRLLKINKLIKSLLVDEYFNQLDNSPLTIHNYWTFLGDKYHKYFIWRLITCPFCVLAPASLLVSLGISDWTWEFFYFFPIIYCSTLIVFFTIKFLSKID